MKKYVLLPLILMLVTSVAGVYTIKSANAAEPQSQIRFDSLTAVYHLSKDSKGLSLLTTEEAIVAEFPGKVYTGITRTIPKKFQGRSVEVKVLSVKNAAGTDVSYKTSNDKEGNLVVSTGDPGIVLFGNETIKIRYNTKGVIDLSGNNDNFLLNVNGRGWNSPFNRVEAILHIPSSFSSKTVGKPSCYTALGNKTNTERCEIVVQQDKDVTKISAKAVNLSANEALLISTSFKAGTFTNQRNLLSKLKTPLLIVAIIVVFMLVVSGAVRIFKVGE